MIDPAPLICCLGGSGSTYLRRRIVVSWMAVYGTTLEVSLRPDTAWISEPALRHMTPSRQWIEGLYDLATTESCDRFKAQSGWRPKPYRSIDGNLADYLIWLARKARGAMFAVAHAHGFFSDHRVHGVIFLVRHPLHAYGSWTKRERHANLVDPVGGKDAQEAAEGYCRRWCSLVDEYHACETNESVLLRFEQAPSDARDHDVLRAATEGWTPDLRNDGALAPATEDLIRSMTEARVRDLYGRWSV